MYCSRRLYKGNEYEICLPIKESGVTQVNFYTDGEIKVEKEPVETTGDTMCFDFSVEDLDVLADGVLRYEVVTEYETTDTNAPFVVVTPGDYSGSTLDDLLEDAYESGLTACSGSSQTDYFAITNLNSELSGEISLVFNGSQSPIFLKTSVDGTNWSEDTEYSATTTFTIQPGGTLYFDGSSNYGKWSESGQNYVSFRQSENNDPNVFYEVSGDLASLIGGGNYLANNYTFLRLFLDFSQLRNAENLNLSFKSLSILCYSGMFEGCTSLTQAPSILPATTLANYCYQNMFYGCTSLIGAPELPATTLTEHCYSNMFYYCISLTSAPELPATTLANYCYSTMFLDCKSLITAPELPATSLTDNCYAGMFYGCTGLTTAPSILPATALANYCYSNMFLDCKSLITAPELPATELAYGCYSNMFSGCRSITQAPELPATELAQGCYDYMFAACTSLTSAPELPAETLANYCYSNMFFGCTNLNYIKCLATNIPAGNCTTGWANGVASSGTFVKHPNMSSWTTGVNGIPANWTVIDADI